MKKTILGILILLVISSCNEKQTTEFSLSGEVNGIENGIFLYLETPSDRKVIDSAKVENGSFIFNTKLSKAPLQVLLRTRRFSHYRFLWLENKSMNFDATQTDFRDAIVTGSDEENLSQIFRKETDSLSEDEQLEGAKEFVNKYPNSIHSAYILSIYASTFGKDISESLFEQFSAENKNTEYGKQIAKYIELNKNPKIGEEYVDFEMKDTNGETRKLSDTKGELILLEFWSANCGVCREENTNLVKTYEKYNPKGFEIFAVSIDSNKESWLRAIEEDKLTWLQVSDLKGIGNAASLIYGINGVPDNFLIDKNGVIVGRNLRGEKLNEKLSELLN